MITDMAKDWQKQPFVNMAYANDDGVCPEGYEVLYTSYWSGTVEGCLVEKEPNYWHFYDTEVVTEEEYDAIYAET